MLGHALRPLALTGLALLGLAGPALAADRALVIGVDRYPKILKEGRSGETDLRGAVYDAESFATLLVEEFRFARADIKVLTDAEATRERIVGEFRSWLVAGTRPGDNVVFFFAGHGAQAFVTEADGSTRLTSALVPADATGELVAEPARIDGLIRGPEMAQLLAEVKDRNVMVFADACFSGSVTRGAFASLRSEAGPGARARTITPRRPVHMRAADITDRLTRDSKVSSRLIAVDANEAAAVSPDRLVAWQAATTAQVTFDHPERGGVFTQSFIEGLKGKARPADASGVSAGALLDYVRREAERLCKAFGDECRAGLTPNLVAPEAYRGALLPPRAIAVEAPAPGAPAGKPAPSIVATEPPPPPAGAPALAPVVVQAAATLAHRSDFDLQAEILPGRRVRLGESVRFRIRSGQDATLLVLDTGPDGKLRQIFPNRVSERATKGGRVRAGAPLIIPDASYGFAFEATDRGPGTLLVIAAETAVDLAAAARELDFAPISNPSRAIQVIGTQLQKPVLSEDVNIPNRAARWAFARVDYVVE